MQASPHANALPAFTLDALRRVAAGARPELGLRRIDWVHVETGPGGRVRCDVLGMGHRLPTTRRVPLAVAVTLMAAGVPSVVRVAPAAHEERHEGGDHETEERR